jgi:hypothetical protein
MVSDYRLTGLEKLNNDNYMSATIEPYGFSDSFKALIEGDNKFKDSLWKYCEGNWGNLKAIVYHEGDIMNPINPIVKRVEHII